MKKLLEEKIPGATDEHSSSLVPLDPLAAYLAEIKQYKPLSAEKEKELAILYREKGDVEAAYVLVTSNLQQVVAIAMSFRREFQDLLDLIQEGNVGLMRAVKKFDPFRGIRLPTYASWWIKSYILKYILDNWRLVKVGTTNIRRKLLYNLQKEKERLEQAGCHPTTKLLAEKFGASETDVVAVERSLGASDLSLDAPLGAGNDDSRVIDVIPLEEGSVEDRLSRKQLREMIRSKINNFKKRLSEREIAVLEGRILNEDKETLQEIGDRFGVTREAIRQVEKKLLRKVRTFIKKEVPEAEHWEA